MMRRYLPLLLAVPIAGCGHSPATTTLVIDPAPPAQAVASYAGPPLRVPALRVPAALDRPEFVQQLAAGTLQVADFDRWAAPLGLLARDALIGNLAQRLPGGSTLPPDASPVPPEVRVEPSVLLFQATGGQAVMDVAWATTRTGGAPVRHVARLTTPLADATPVAQAQAMGVLLGQFADRIVAALPPR